MFGGPAGIFPASGYGCIENANSVEYASSKTDNVNTHRENEMKIKKLQGLIAAAHTGFNADGSVNYAVIEKQAQMLIKQKVTGVYVSGTTGEGICCSLDERKAVFDAWVKAAKGKLFLIAHIGALALPDVQELGAYAVKCGMDATSIVPPNFFKPGSVDMLIAYLKEALKTSEKLPFYYYHTSMSGVTFDMQTFLEKADGQIKNLAGIKFNYSARSRPSARPTTTRRASTTRSGTR